MQKIKQNYKSLIVGTLLALAVVFAPTVGLAKDGGNDDKDNHSDAKVEQHLSEKAVNSDKSNSIFNRFARLFGATKADAAVNLRPNISGISAPTMLKTGQEGTWKVRASDPENGSLSYDVNWGDNSSPGIVAKMAQLVVQEGTFSHIYTKPGNYKIVFTVSDEAGAKSTSSVTVRVVGKPTVQAPVISNLSANPNKPTNATIRWSTDVRASTMVWLNTVSPVDTSGAPDISRPGKILNHKVKLNNLTPDTKYYVIVGSGNGGGTTMSSEISFTTPANKKAPTISKLVGPATIEAGALETVTVEASDPNNSPLSYSVDWGDTMTIMAFVKAEEPFVQTATFDHIYASAGEYTATFTVKNEAGLKDSETLKIKVTQLADTTAPVISGQSVTPTSIGATISWTTDEPADSEILYSTTTPINMGTALSVSDANLSTTHSLNITGLTASTLYHFIIESSDSAGNTSVTSESTFTTSAGS